MSQKPEDVENPKPDSEASRRAEVVRAALEAFREHEWVRADWQGLCSMRRAIPYCKGTDGHVSAVGTPKPVAHAEHCPYSKLPAALAALDALVKELSQAREDAFNKHAAERFAIQRDAECRKRGQLMEEVERLKVELKEAQHAAWTAGARGYE